MHFFHCSSTKVMIISPDVDVDDIPFSPVTSSVNINYKTRYCFSTNLFPQTITNTMGER